LRNTVGFLLAGISVFRGVSRLRLQRYDIFELNASIALLPCIQTAFQVKNKTEKRTCQYNLLLKSGG